MRQITLKIAPGQSEDIAVVGDYVRVKTASVPVRLRDEIGALDASIEQGDALSLKPFETLRVSHADAAEQTITLFIGLGTRADSSKVGGSINLAAARAFSQSSVAVGAASVQVAAANSARAMLLIQNTSTGGQDIYLSFSGAATTAGIKLTPGASVLLDAATPSGAVNAIASAAGGAVAVVEG